MKQFVISKLNRELFVPQNQHLEEYGDHDLLGQSGSKAIMNLLSLQFKNSRALRLYIDENLSPDDAGGWYKELKKQEFTADYIRKHQEFNHFYNERTGRNDVEKQPELTSLLDSYLREERIRKEQAEKQEGKV